MPLADAISYLIALDLQPLRNTVKQCNLLKTKLTTEITEYTELKNA